MGIKKKVLYAISIILVLMAVFFIFDDSEVRGEKYPTSTQDLELVKTSEIIELTDGDKIDLSIDIIKKEIAGKGNFSWRGS